MSNPFLAEIRIFPFNFAPQGWAFCNGQILPISQYTALFSLLGTTYGGNGTSTFGLPNLQGNVPIQPGQAPGLSQYVLGQMGGFPTVTLLQNQLPAHPHSVNAKETPPPATDPSPSNTEVFARSNGAAAYANAASFVAMSPSTIGLAGGNTPHNNLMPYITLNFCIALQGIFPPRS